jgi:TusA-related sulfurtransferase/predicted HTH domain antitoxin
MKIDKDTKISELLKIGDDLIEVIKEIHPKFSKLSNPLLRKALAPRVTVKDASRIAGIPVNDFLKKLEEKGCEVEYDTSPETAKYVTECDLLEKYKPVRVDAVKLLEQNIDPFDTIRKKLKTLTPGEALEVVVDFIPVPLIEIFEKQGYQHCVLLKDGIYYTYFYKPYKKPGLLDKLKSFLGLDREEKSVEQAVKKREEDFDTVKRKFEGRMKMLDVRDLEMPQPMMTILENLETLQPEEALFVEHKRVPQFLLPELEKKNYLWTTKKINDSHTQMIIYKKPEND